MKNQITPQPFVKWVGGKRSLINELIKRLPKNFNSYYEPFIGGGALFFSLCNKLEKAILIDKNLELVITYNAIKKQPKKLIERLKQHARNHSETHYYFVRQNKPTSPLDIAARFLYLNKTCFNGLYRVNKSGGFNVPIGKYSNPNIVQESNILACHKALDVAEIKYGDFSHVEPQKQDFAYFDPPYHPTSEASFTAYTKDNFMESDQIRLRDYIVKLHRKGVYIMLSNSSTEFIRDLYKAKYFNHHEVFAPRYINCKPGERGKVSELLITNY
ncbi:DNA adenine methylase [Patescibacteria group bacterium]|nr:DNA adenine methylase [Patescibacteria group bacterium]